MEVGNRIRKFRTELGFNQDELAEKIYVSRQTISNWENNKSYPDINSLIRLGDVFGISLDTLIKGDIEIMREAIKKEDIKKFGALTKVYVVMLLAVILSVVPLFKVGIIGIIIWAVLFAATMFVAFKVEKEKKVHDLKTYRQISAFMEGKHLDELETTVENGKAKYQAVLLAIGVGLFAVAVCTIIGILLK